MKKIQKCTCPVKEKGTFDDNSLVMIGEGLLHVFLIAVFWYAFNIFVAAAYVGLLLLLFLVWYAQARGRSHTHNCSLRRGFLRALDLGSYITPF